MEVDRVSSFNMKKSQLEDYSCKPEPLELFIKTSKISEYREN